MPAMTRFTVHFTGNVQGVGFRATTCSVARSHVAAGYVKNLSDGSVELVVEGDAKELKALVNDVRDAMRGNIDDHTIDESAASGEFGEPQPGGVRVRH